MRVFTIILLFLCSITLASLGQVRQDYEAPQSRPDSAKGVEIFPNPAVDYVHVRFEHLVSNNIRFTVHNIIGNEIQIETELVDEHEVRIRVKDLNAGYYLLALKDNEENFKGIYKFLKR
jgi:hypothetical protein